MKRVLLALLLLSSFALAGDCQERLDKRVDNVKEFYAHDTYDYQARLGEAYANAAECFEEEQNEQKAKFYYTQAGNDYTKAGNMLTQDFGLKAALFNSAGVSYSNAGLFSPAIASYKKTIALYETYPNQVSANLREEAEKGIQGFKKPATGLVVKEVPPGTNYSLFYVALAALVVVVLILLVSYTRRR